MSPDAFGDERADQSADYELTDEFGQRIDGVIQEELGSGTAPSASW